MKKLFMCILFVLFFFVETAVCVEVGGVTLPDTLKVGDADLVLNGYGLRTKFGFKVYAVGIYTKAKSSDNNAIINADEPMALIMNWRRKVPVRKIEGVFFDSFAEIVKAPPADDYDASSDYGPLTKEIVSFLGIIAERPTTKKDTHTYKYIPGKGTDVYAHDGTAETFKSTIAGLEFKKALFAIWLADDAPVGKKLKKKLLGL